ncbi:MAG: HYExAFE family protein [Phycisphaeraceae bacterium]|nr:HYExAFE family protein [Phycisphaeraceae bacterium]
MAQRRHHYEHAFEGLLRGRRVPYVAVDEARRALLPSAFSHSAPSCSPGHEAGATPGDPCGALKSFDFVIYGQGANLLVEVKGRRLAGAGRMESWVTAEDVRSLSRWETLFGPEFEAAFVFLYWCDGQPPDALFEDVFEHGGRWYAARCVRVREYARHMRTRSERWHTVDLPRAAYERLAAPLMPRAHALWGATHVGDAPPLLEPVG